MFQLSPAAKGDVTMHPGVKKVDQIRVMLDVGIPPREIASKIPCALSLVYQVRGRRDVAMLRHEVGELREALYNLVQRTNRLEGKSVDLLAERMLRAPLR